MLLLENLLRVGLKASRKKESASLMRRTLRYTSAADKKPLIPGATGFPGSMQAARSTRENSLGSEKSGLVLPGRASSYRVSSCRVQSRLVTIVYENIRSCLAGSCRVQPSPVPSHRVLSGPVRSGRAALWITYENLRSCLVLSGRVQPCRAASGRVESRIAYENIRSCLAGSSLVLPGRVLPRPAASRQQTNETSQTPGARGPWGPYRSP